MPQLHNCAEDPTRTFVCDASWELCALYSVVFRKFTQIRTMESVRSPRGVLQVRQTAASPRGYRGFRSILSYLALIRQKIMRSWGEQGREPGPLRDHRETRAVGRRDGEWHDAIALPWPYVIQSCKQKEGKRRKKKKRRGRDDCFDYRRRWMTKSPVDGIRRSARHRLTNAFFRRFAR